MPDVEKRLHGELLARKKVRRGTVSCWECKRRKVRCRFEGAQEAMCIPCKSRGTLCISQEHPDTGRTPQLGDRLTRVETLLAEVLERLNAGEAATPAEHRVNNIQENGSQIERVVGSTPIRLEPAEDVAYQHRYGTPSPPPVTLSKHAVQIGSETPKDHTILSKALLSALPSEASLDMILRNPFEIPSCLYGLFSPTSTEAGVASATDSWQLPSSDLHPVLVARSFLVLSCCLQGMRPDVVISLSLADIDCHQIGSDLANIVRSHVLHNDDLLHSVDGVECLLLESMYHNNAGNLRKAWFSSRRALMTGQMLRLHRGPAAHQDSQRSCFLWHRLLQQDRYLSLMLGLPEGAPGSHNIASHETLASCDAVECLERLDTFAAGCILQRNAADTRNNDFTCEIGSILQKATASLPPRWWLIPSSFDIDDPDFGNGMLRLMRQLAHFHLLTRLHLPYLLHSVSETSHEQSRHAAMNASREILARYVTFRRSTTSKSYCRGVDFIMFIACTTICLGHVNHTLQQRINGTSSQQFSCLAHQRHLDRGLMESALEILESSQMRDDAIYSQLTTILMHLLKSEADADAGTAVLTSLSTDIEQECSGELDAGERTLRISIPWIGAVTFQRIVASPDHSQIYTGDVALEYLNVTAMDTDPGFKAGDIWPLQDVDAALFDDIFHGLNTSFSTQSNASS